MSLSPMIRSQGMNLSVFLTMSKMIRYLSRSIWGFTWLRKTPRQIWIWPWSIHSSNNSNVPKQSRKWLNSLQHFRTLGMLLQQKTLMLIINSVKGSSFHYMTNLITNPLATMLTNLLIKNFKMKVLKLALLKLMMQQMDQLWKMSLRKRNRLDSILI